jgi:hypothetical protein
MCAEHLKSIANTFNCKQPCITSINNSHTIHPISSSNLCKQLHPISPLCKQNTNEMLTNFSKSMDNQRENNNNNLDYVAHKRAQHRLKRMSTPNGLALELIYISYQKLVPNKTQPVKCCDTVSIERQFHVTRLLRKALKAHAQ